MHQPMNQWIVKKTKKNVISSSSSLKDKQWVTIKKRGSHRLAELNDHGREWDEQDETYEWIHAATQSTSFSSYLFFF